MTSSKGISSGFYIQITFVRSDRLFDRRGRVFDTAMPNEGLNSGQFRIKGGAAAGGPAVLGGPQLVKVEKLY